MNENEIERIAAAVNVLRPDWPTPSLRTFIAKKLGMRPRRDVAVALAWVACDSATTTPARVLENGPWWKAVAIEEATTTHHHVAKVYGWSEGDPRTVCGICALDRNDCKRREKTSGHEFVARINCRPPIDYGVRYGLVREQRACGAAILNGSSCRLKTGHEGDHAMSRTPTTHTTPTPDPRADARAALQEDA